MLNRIASALSVGMRLPIFFAVMVDVSIFIFATAIIHQFGVSVGTSALVGLGITAVLDALVSGIVGLRMFFPTRRG